MKYPDGVGVPRACKSTDTVECLCQCNDKSEASHLCCEFSVRRHPCVCHRVKDVGHREPAGGLRLLLQQHLPPYMGYRCWWPFHLATLSGKL